MGREILGGIQIRDMHVDLYKKLSFAMRKITCRITGSLNSSPSWKLENWVCDDALGRHMWVSEHTISCEEAKVLEARQYDLANPCIVQWGMLWFSAPASLNNDLLNDGVILEKYNEAVDLTILATFTMPFWRMHTPRSCFLRSLRTVWTNTPESLERGQRYEVMGTW